MFGVKQARACLFAGTFLLLLFLSNYINLFGLPRYDFLFLAAIAIQIILYLSGLESKDEIKVICVFHLVGLALELFKTHPAIASWSYPEYSFFKVGTVPLYSGFMYAAVASYMIQSFRVLKLRILNYPSYQYSVPLAVAVYLNFFTHHFLPDVRWILIILIIIVFWRAKVNFLVIEKRREISLVLSFFLIAFFVWVAENFGTYFGAWQYPSQELEWSLVSVKLLSSWTLMVIISFIIVADLRKYKDINLN